MEIFISSLVVETTRKCNMRCRHCMRGDAQNQNLHIEMLEKFLKDVDGIGSITFSGGEPSLNLKPMRWFADYLQTHSDFHCGYFYVVTNGKQYNEEFLDVLREIYFRCSEQEECRLVLSKDKFHERISDRCYNFYMGFEEKIFDYPFLVNECGEPEIEIKKLPSILGRGRALDYGIATNFRPVGEKLHVDYVECFERNGELCVDISDDTVYLNVFGEVFADCDLSYEQQEKYAIGDLRKENLSDIVLRELGYKSESDFIESIEESAKEYDEWHGKKEQ